MKGVPTALNISNISQIISIKSSNFAISSNLFHFRLPSIFINYNINFINRGRIFICLGTKHMGTISTGPLKKYFWAN